MASRALKNRPAVRKRRGGTVLAGAFIVLAALLAGGTVAAFALADAWLEDLPDYENTALYDHPQSTVIYASDGEIVLADFQPENRQPVAFDQISSHVIWATVAIEDERFFQHAGIDLQGIARALLNNLMGGRLEGASTITQQYVRNTVLASEMTDISLKRKVREAYVALRLEDMFEKEEILAKYLNTINYGSGCYGIEAAAQRYFSKSASELTLVEAATLAGIPQSPSYNNPIDYPDACLARRNAVLDRMRDIGVISQEECSAAQAEPLTLTLSDPPSTGILQFPYFTSYVRNRLVDPQGPYGYTDEQLRRGGLKVYTTLDVDMQLAAEEAARAKQDEANRAAGVENVFECAMVALDPSTGHIKALVGGRRFEESEVNMATGEGGMGRQAGSSFKTFTLVAALERGIDPETLIDASSTVAVSGSTPVSNIDGRNYGTRSIASAFAVSSNTAFVRLIMSLGPDTVADVAHRMGIVAQLPHVASITLGTEAVTPLEMASAYGTLAAGGVHYEPECILRVEDAQGNVLVNNDGAQGEQAVSPEVAHAAIEVMKGVVTQGTGWDAALDNGQPVAGKTGTSDKYRDSWFCGITPQLSVAVWLGDRSDYAQALSVPSQVTATSAFSQFMNAVLADSSVEDFAWAEKPVYKRYVDATRHIGAYYASSDDSEGDDEDDTEDDGGKDDAGQEGAAGSSGDTSADGAPSGDTPSGDAPSDPGTVVNEPGGAGGTGDASGGGASSGVTDGGEGGSGGEGGAPNLSGSGPSSGGSAAAETS